MNILIVYAHPGIRSFDHAMKNKAVEVLAGEGHLVQVSDLHDMGFKAHADAKDFVAPLNAETCNFQMEQINASQHSTFANDILQEQHKVLWADAIIFQFPLWWYSVPAIMKGWFDRILTHGFAYGPGSSTTGKRAVLVLTTGGTPRPFTPEKRIIITNMLEHIQRGILYFCGFDVLPPFAIYGASNTTPDQREQFLLQYTQLLRSIENITPIDYSRKGW